MSHQAILLIEDESSIADALRYALERDGYKVYAASTGSEGLRQLSNVRVGLVILDVGLPDMSGFDVCRSIRTQSDVPVVFLTARNEEIDRILGLELGADDYVTKPFSTREVVARVKAILRRGTQSGASSTPATKNPHFDIDPERCRISFRGQPLDLSRYEYRLLALLVKRPGKVFTREELMDRAWETPEMSLERTVDTHIKTIRSKLRAIDADDDSIITHRGTGYSLREAS